MKYISGSFEEYVLSLLAVTGEIDYELMLSSFPQKRYFYNEVQRLCEKKVLLKTSRAIEGKKRKIIRLSSSNGYERLQNLPEEFVKHFDLLERVSGDESISLYKGNSHYRNRLFQRSAFWLRLYLSGVCDIDFLETLYAKRHSEAYKELSAVVNRHPGNSLMSKDGGAISMNEMLRWNAAGDRRLHFITAKVLYDQLCREGYSFENSFMNSVTVGSFLKENRLIPAYNVETCTRWSSDLEVQYASTLDDKLEYYIGKHQDKEAIFFLSAKDMFAELLGKDGFGKTADKIAVSHSSSYLVPVDVDWGNVISLIMTKSYEDEIMKSLMKDYTYRKDPKSYIYGYYKGSRVYSFLTCNYKQISHLKTEGLAEDALLIIHEWQAPFVQDKFKEIRTAITLSEKEISDYINDGIPVLPPEGF